MSAAEMDLLNGMEMTKSEYEWLERRFENMTVAEKLKFAGAMDILHPQDVETVIGAASQLEKFSLLPGAGDDGALGRYVLDHVHTALRKALPYLDAEKAGRLYREEHGGSFQSGHFVRQEAKLDIDRSVPLPYLQETGDYAIRVKSAGECIVLDVDCRFPQLTDIPAQYDSAAELVRHAVDLGYLWEEQGQGEMFFLEKWQAVLELEGCTRLDLALDLGQNLRCYEFIPRNVDLAVFGRRKAILDGVVREYDGFVLNCFDGAAYAGEYARQFSMSATEHGFAAWNGTPLTYEYSQPPQEQMMTMT